MRSDLFETKGKTTGLRTFHKRLVEEDIPYFFSIEQTLDIVVHFLVLVYSLNWHKLSIS